jgi:branched-chain amino acid transport system permease protein
MKIAMPRARLLSLLSLVLLGLFLWWASGHWDPFLMRMLRLCGIYIILGLGVNVVNGLAGQFSLGHGGFMLVGAYTLALLTLTPEKKEMCFYLVPLIAPLRTLTVPFAVALVAAAILAGIVGFLIGAPALRVRGDYLALLTLAFSESIVVLTCNLLPITNGALGLKGIVDFASVWWVWGIAVLAIVLTRSLAGSNYGRALKAIREDEIAAEAMGVNLFFHKTLAFVYGAVLCGVGGALLASVNSAIDPLMFGFYFTFQILVMVIVGGLGSVTGTVIGAPLVTIMLELLRFIDNPVQLGPLRIPGIVGMRMVLFSIFLLMAILFFREGLVGSREFSWEGLASGLGKIPAFFGRGKKSVG